MLAARFAMPSQVALQGLPLTVKMAVNIEVSPPSGQIQGQKWLDHLQMLILAELC
jgi:hypothetical protein